MKLRFCPYTEMDYELRKGLGMNLYPLIDELKELGNKDKATLMKAYMRDRFEFLGIATPLRKNTCKPYFKEAKKEAVVDWGFVDACWDCEYRELQYVAIGYLSIMADKLSPIDIPRIKNLALTKSWWDSIDGLDAIVGTIAFNYPEVNKTLLEWSTDENFWLRRIAIDHQLKRKSETDTALLEAIIVNNLGETEFFINKAIGWSLREYSKTDANWVRSFIEKYGHKMAPLSIREATKYV